MGLRVGWGRMSELAVRRASTSDTVMLLRWIAHPPSRRWVRDEVWLHGVVTAVDATLLVVECEGRPMASAHCDQVQGGVWRVTIIIAPGWHSHAGLLFAVEEFLGRHHHVGSVLTVVHRDDRVALSMVGAAGYAVRAPSSPGSPYVEFVKWASPPRERITPQQDEVPLTIARGDDEGNGFWAV